MQPILFKNITVTVFSALILFLMAPLQAGGDPSPSSDRVKLGKQVYNRCMGCHSLDRNRTGPKHCGILGRKAGSVKNYDYSDALANSDIIWSRETLSAYIKSPFDFISGTTMGFSGIKDAEERSALIDYLITVNDSSECAN